VAILVSLGPSIKYVTLEGDGVFEGATVCDGGELSQGHVTSRFSNFLSYIIIKPEIENDA